MKGVAIRITFLFVICYLLLLFTPLVAAISMFVERRTEIADLEFGLVPGKELGHVSLMKTVPIPEKFVEVEVGLGKQLQAVSTKAVILLGEQVRLNEDRTRCAKLTVCRGLFLLFTV